MTRPRTLRLLAPSLICLAAFLGAFGASDGHAFDQPTIRNSDLFCLPDSATHEDSLKALHLWSRTDSTCVVMFTVVTVEVPDLDELDFYQSANPVLKKVYETELTVVTINVSRVIVGDCAIGEYQLYTLANTPLRGADIAGVHRQVLIAGYEAIGVISQRASHFDGKPSLQTSSYFVFGIPGSERYRRQLVDPVVSLYESYFRR